MITVRHVQMWDERDEHGCDLDGARRAQVRQRVCREPHGAAAQLGETLLEPRHARCDERGRELGKVALGNSERLRTAVEQQAHEGPCVGAGRRGRGEVLCTVHHRPDLFRNSRVVAECKLCPHPAQPDRIREAGVTGLVHEATHAGEQRGIARDVRIGNRSRDLRDDVRVQEKWIHRPVGFDAGERFLDDHREMVPQAMNYSNVGSGLLAASVIA
ncbi:MAG: hypothetical protein H0T46_05060 [Deltaproteobacteria bacterium]|nr:hypothetical protein [Deltaproteobacteria bacterium]